MSILILTHRRKINNHFLIKNFWFKGPRASENIVISRMEEIKYTKTICFKNLFLVFNKERQNKHSV